MPRVQQYGPSQVQTQVSSGPQARALPQEAFPLAQAAGAVQDIGQVFAGVAERVAITEAEQTALEFEREKNKLFFDPDAGYFNTQGRAAYDAAQGTTEALQQLKDQFGARLSNPTAQRAFDQVASRHLQSAQVDIMRHASGGLKAWETATVKARAENSIENAALYWGDSEKLAVQREVGRAAVMDAAEMEGITGEALNERLQTFESSFAAASIEAAAQRSAEEGARLLEEHGDRLEGPLRAKAEKLIDTRRKAEKTQRDAQLAVIKATNLVDAYEEDRAGLIAEVNGIEDPELRKKTMSEAMYQFNQRKTARSEQRAAAFEQAEELVAQGTSPEQIKAQLADQWEILSPSQRKKIEAGEGVVTDYNQLADLLLLPKDKLAAVDPTDHYASLAPRDRTRLITAVKAARGTASGSEKADAQTGRSRTAQTSSTVELLFGAKKKRGGQDRRRVEAFYSLLDDEVAFREEAKGAKLTSQEYTAVLSDLSRRVVIEKNWWPDSEQDITEVPADVIPQLTKFLHDSGIPATADNIMRAYEQAR